MHLVLVLVCLIYHFYTYQLFESKAITTTLQSQCLTESHLEYCIDTTCCTDKVFPFAPTHYIPYSHDQWLQISFKMGPLCCYQRRRTSNSPQLLRLVHLLSCFYYQLLILTHIWCEGINTLFSFAHVRVPMYHCLLIPEWIQISSLQSPTLC
jgi:hypothetical protein